MNREHPAWAAHAMRALDEPMRNALIAQSDNCIDMREAFERKQMERHVTVVYLECADGTE